MSSFVYNPPLEPYLNILYADDDILVCDKPNGLLSVRGKAPEHQDSLEVRVKRVYPTVGIVHRLDMSTSGIMLMALNKPAHSALARQFQERQTSKTYIARLSGHPHSTQGIVELPLICDWPNRPKQKVCFESGKPSTTYWRLMDKGVDAQGFKFCRVALTPVTGRSHQLRVHMQQIGHAILGDKFYAEPDGFAAACRLQLHAEQLGFYHPVSHEWLDFNCPCPF
ncbi:RNA pseudouridine synthase [Saccharobesus litoralis]|uniref:Dual-specificity RNA pseudouridine synthase RluA n=1 Tax=Saccharobesus litoralis TaxID=2172099 RepID=A0A2S0VRR5_9ALTE|nr:pseudouridine synthase [Saccharobesus litoralis]AWB66883.1 RNA pseudouridine synthase [Saccharobesus litoralis]